MPYISGVHLADAQPWRPFHKRDANGHLVCVGACGESYPYAEPPKEGTFVCKSCKSYEEMYEGPPPSTPTAVEVPKPAVTAPPTHLYPGGWVYIV